MSVSKEEILGELAQVLREECRQPEDIDKNDIQASTGLSMKVIEKKMRQLVKAGEYTEHIVRGFSGYRCQVWRKVGN